MYHRPNWLYLAQDIDTGKLVLLKECCADIVERPFMVELSHPHLMRVLDLIGSSTDPEYSVLEFVRGESLTDKLEQHTRLHSGRQFDKRYYNKSLTSAHTEPGQIIQWVVECLSAMQYLHQRDFLYGNVKPDHVLIENNLVKLIDLADLHELSNGHPLKVPAIPFRAPEFDLDFKIIEDWERSIASDIFAMARVLSVFLFPLTQTEWSNLDYGAPAATAMISQDDKLHSILDKATERKPDMRYESAQERIHDLRAWQEGLNQAQMPEKLAA